MKVFSKQEEVRKDLSGKGVVLTLGNFDGVHLGHQHLLRSLVDEAKRISAVSLAMTFDPHPQKILKGESPHQITTLPQKSRFIAETGVDVLWIHPFTEEFSRLSYREFLQYLSETVSLKGFVIGYDLRFGFRGEGDGESLRRWARERGIEVRDVPPWRIGEETVSSRRIREVLKEGNVVKARFFLGRPWQIWGEKGSGAGRGKVLGFPTLNVVTRNDLLVPDGVYGGRTRIGGKIYISAISVGTNPTFGSEPRHTEIYLLDYTPQEEEREMEVEFWTYVRDQVKFSSASLLIQQMEEDVKGIREQAQRERWLDFP
jgi:riboflavin kinase/FMN adenylyltransferase